MAFSYFGYDKRTVILYITDKPEGGTVKIPVTGKEEIHVVYNMGDLIDPADPQKPLLSGNILATWCTPNDRIDQLASFGTLYSFVDQNTVKIAAKYAAPDFQKPEIPPAATYVSVQVHFLYTALLKQFPPT